jgi:hypothetical protein
MGTEPCSHVTGDEKQRNETTKQNDPSRKIGKPNSQETPKTSAPIKTFNSTTHLRTGLG